MAVSDYYIRGSEVEWQSFAGFWKSCKYDLRQPITISDVDLEVGDEYPRDSTYHIQQVREAHEPGTSKPAVVVVAFRRRLRSD